MKKHIILLLLVFTSLSITAQNVGIGTASPEPSAKLDISATDRGFLMPRVSLVGVTDGVSPVNAPATGLLVYNTNAAVTGGAGAGFYYWDGSEWVPLGASSGTYWDLNANTTGLQAIPGGSTASGAYALTAGENNIASGQGSFSHGRNNQSQGTYAITTGLRNTAADYCSYSHGQDNQSLGLYTYCHGQDNLASILYAYTHGQNNTSSERYAYSHGQNNTSSQRYAYTHGQGNQALGVYAFAQGENVTASSDFSIAFGDASQALGIYAAVLGGRDNVVNNDYGVIVGGRDNTVNNNYATTVGGRDNRAEGVYSFASGRGNIAASFGETVVGLYSTTYTPTSLIGSSNNDRIFVVGNGSLTTRSNAMTIYKDGRTGINTDAPTAMFDINGADGYDQLRLRQSFTPSGTVDARGNTGDVSWDDDFIYIKTSTGWKRSALTNF